MTKYIPLTRGMVALVDDEDYKRLNPYKWTYLSSGYAYRQVIIKGKPVTILMHRFIMDAADEFVVDHINGNGLDNRRCNLRICTQANNMKNQRSRVGSSSFKGVSFDNRYRLPWFAYIWLNRKKHHLGNFATEEEAARAYNEAAVKLHGEFARLNDI